MPSALALPEAKVHGEGGLWSHVRAKASVRNEINYRDIR